MGNGADWGVVHHPRRMSNGVARAEWKARKSDDLLRRDFGVERHLEKYITGLRGKNGTLYVSVIFGCFGLTILGLAMDSDIRQSCMWSLDAAAVIYPGLRGAIIQSDRGS